MNKTLAALAIACASLTAVNASTLDVTHSQNEWFFNLTIGTDIAPVVPGTWSIDGNAIAVGTSAPFSPFRFDTLPANYADIWFLTPNVAHIVSFATDGLVLTGDEPYFITAPTIERPVNLVPEALGGAWLGLTLVGLAGLKRALH